MTDKFNTELAEQECERRYRAASEQLADAFVNQKHTTHFFAREWVFLQRR